MNALTKSFVCLMALVLFASCTISKSAKFEIEKISSDNYKISIDGNSWNTTKDSISIYIENY